MVPTETVDDVLEFVFDLEFDVGWIEVDSELGEIRHEDRADDSVRAVDQ